MISESKLGYERQIDHLNEQIEHWKRQSQEIKNFYEAQLQSLHHENNIKT